MAQPDQWVVARLRSFMTFSKTKLEAALAESAEQDAEEHFQELVSFTKGLVTHVKNIGATASVDLKVSGNLLQFVGTPRGFGSEGRKPRCPWHARALPLLAPRLPRIRARKHECMRIDLLLNERPLFSLQTKIAQVFSPVWDLFKNEPGPDLKGGEASVLEKDLNGLIDTLLEGLLKEVGASQERAPPPPKSALPTNLNTMSLQDAITYMWTVLDKPNRVEYGNDGFELDMQSKVHPAGSRPCI
jgi:hypothetical protein